MLQTFSGFQKWMVATDRSTATAAFYVSNLRAAVRKLGYEPTRDALLEYHAMLSKERRRGFRAAWKAFAEYAKEQGKTIVCPPFPTGRNVIGATEKFSALHEIVLALVQGGLTPEEMAQLRVNSISGRPPDIAILKTNTKKVEFPRPLIVKLLEYAVPGWGKEPLPFVDPFWHLFAERPPGYDYLSPGRIQQMYEDAKRVAYNAVEPPKMSKTGSGAGEGSEDPPAWL